MKGRDFPFTPLLLLCAMIYIAYWMYTNVGFKDEEFDVNQSAEAYDNQHLAATRLLNHYGFETDIIEDRSVFAELNSNVGVLWLERFSAVLDERETDKIRQWVERGGILLASPAAEFDEFQPKAHHWFLRDIGIVPIEQVPDDDGEVPGIEFTDEETYAHTLVLPDAGLENTELELSSDYLPYFQLDMRQATGDVSNIVDNDYLLVQQVGKGQVALYADEDLFSNSNFGEHSQGYALMWLTQSALKKRVSLIFDLRQHPGLTKTMWRKFALAICMGMVAIAVFLRWATSRLGPIEHEDVPVKNNIIEHLRARGEFWYRHKNTTKMLEDIRASAIASLNQDAGVSDNITKETTIKRACELLKCSEKAAEQALYSNSLNDKSIFHAARLLRKLNHRQRFRPLSSTESSTRAS